MNSQLNNIKFTLVAILVSFMTGCAMTGESYTDEGIGNTTVVVPKVSANSNLPEASGALPEIAPYDEPAIPPLDAPAIE